MEAACQHGTSIKEATCPQCNEMTSGEYVETTPGDGKYHFICKHCGFEWFER